MSHRLPILWSIAGHDSSGGAGLSADQRAADALGVHLCPVIAAVTAQNSQGVQAVVPVDAGTLEAQLAALALDLPPRAIKTGLLGSVAAIKAVARWVDHLRAATPPGEDPHRQLALVIDPVLGASAGGATFADPSVLSAYRKLLIPRATVITPNRLEAARLLAWPQASHGLDQGQLPEMARQLQQLGARGVVITGGDAVSVGEPASPTAQAIDWLLTPHATGWLTAPRIDTRHTHGTGCTFATGIAAALALGHVEADAVVLAKMLTHHALSQGHAAGQGAGPVIAGQGFAAGPHHGGAPLPWLGLDEQLPWALQGTRFAPFTAPADGLYGIVDSADRIKDGVASGLRLLQLRRKSKAADLAQQLATSLDACASAQATLFINDHWREALALSASTDASLGLHLGQEDLLALSPQDQALLLSARHRISLGLSSHSLWELARAAGCGASLIACGPVLPTTTKDMPWQPQGHNNLRWWVAHSPAPVVAIGGLLNEDDVGQAASCGPAAVCVVRGLGSTLTQTQAALPVLQQAVSSGRAGHQPAGPVQLPHPVL
ncbi:MAG: bifunctional hydroxymethylpyrimidine kinase/phosphomethylpyrimidine kinase [Aquabacterium sp.]|uniref:bifunctional hydroxymethylpyrimidine kinase/phosphomethylpyrimidine kinase n=1 Tax=Aquabacterium sp. TaxID=1872578 RepID=UPI0027192F4E|nr:bifunctional hydroxymethylpyrimidine kinase/phosphomethylpyrimidine kinase [Aquabacterium sp.]MDO9002087.1 bifunctional hydroxymethylpyrimidine kinase/phosphomethylpyrimidine kinase [Aquabacterium sp.]